MLDFDLASLYQVEARAFESGSEMSEIFKSFPDDFMFSAYYDKTNSMKVTLKVVIPKVCSDGAKYFKPF